jgi:hypothetical protein
MAGEILPQGERIAGEVLQKMTGDLRDKGRLQVQGPQIVIQITRKDRPRLRKKHSLLKGHYLVMLGLQEVKKLFRYGQELISCAERSGVWAFQTLKT